MSHDDEDFGDRGLGDRGLGDRDLGDRGIGARRLSDPDADGQNRVDREPGVRRSAGQSPAGPAGPVGPDPVEPDGLTGPELARAVLDAAKARRDGARRDPRRDGGRARSAGQGTGDGRQGRRLRGYSGPGPDPRDPQPFGAVLARLVQARGWQRPAAEALIFADWPRMVGSDIAEHCRPVKLEQGELTVEADSSAWATQLRLLAGKLVAGIAAQVGHNVVTRLRIHGPAAPSWSRGPRRVRGPGPRDTYG